MLNPQKTVAKVVISCLVLSPLAFGGAGVAGATTKPADTVPTVRLLSEAQRLDICSRQRAALEQMSHRIHDFDLVTDTDKALLTAAVADKNISRQRFLRSYLAHRSSAGPADPHQSGPAVLRRLLTPRRHRSGVGKAPRPVSGSGRG